MACLWVLKESRNCVNEPIDWVARGYFSRTLREGREENFAGADNMVDGHAVVLSLSSCMMLSMSVHLMGFRSVHEVFCEDRYGHLDEMDRKLARTCSAYGGSIGQEYEHVL